MEIINHIFNSILITIYLFVFIAAIFYLFGSFVATLRTGGVPYVPSYNEDLKRMKDYLKLESGKTMIDLGCGDGKALRFFCKEFGIKKAVGYDLNLPGLTLGRIINYLQKNKSIELHQGDFTKIDISGFDYIYLYLLPECLANIEDFIFDGMGEDAIIISNTFKFKKHTPYEVTKNDKGRDRILLYKKNAEISDIPS